MPGFSQSQAKLAKALITTAKTAMELRDELGFPLNEVEKDLAVLIKMKLVEKLGGYPTKYQAIEAVRRRSMDEEATEQQVFRAHIIIEGQSREKPALEHAVKDLLTKMKEDKIVALSNVREDEIVKEDDVYSTLFEADIATKTFEDIIYVILTYGPSSIELEPFNEYALTRVEAQGIVMDIASILQAYASTLVQKDLQVQKYKQDSPELFIK